MCDVPEERDVVWGEDLQNDFQWRIPLLTTYISLVAPVQILKKQMSDTKHILGDHLILGQLFLLNITEFIRIYTSQIPYKNLTWQIKLNLKFENSFTLMFAWSEFLTTNTNTDKCHISTAVM